MEIKKGKKISVNGRFIPETRMDEMSKGVISQNYPQISFKGIITNVLENSCVIDFDDFEMEIPNDDILLF